MHGEEISAQRAAGSYWFDLGDVAVVPLVETERLLIEPEEFFPQLAGRRSPSWCFQSPWYDIATSRIVYAIQSFLVFAAGKIVLVDACVGDVKHRTRPQFNDQRSGWFTRFAATGLDAAEVSAVIFTHLHVDHVGWATRPEGGAWTPVFPQARHCVTEPEYRYWTSSLGSAAMRRTGDYLADSIQPLVDRKLLDFVSPQAVISPHIRLLPAFGHTPGNVCVRVSGSCTDLLITGDTAHHPVQLPHPEWSTRYCVDPRQAARTRHDLLEQLADSGTPMLPSHFACPSVGRIVRAGTGYTFETASDIIRVGQFTHP